MEFVRFLIRNWRGLFAKRGSVATLGIRDSYKYRKAMKAYKAAHPNCEYCGRSKKVDVHHVIPVSVDPSLADKEENMISLCRKPNCHLIVGHMGNYKNYNKNVRETCLVAEDGANTSM